MEIFNDLQYTLSKKGAIVNGTKCFLVWDKNDIINMGIIIDLLRNNFSAVIFIFCPPAGGFAKIFQHIHLYILRNFCFASPKI